MSVLTSAADRAMKPIAWALERHDKSLIGVRNTKALATRYNRLRYGRYQRVREAAVREGFDALLAENTAAQGEPEAIEGVELSDGWALDESHSLPHLEPMLEQANEVIEERTGTQWEEFTRPFLQNLLPQEWLTRYPALLDFATSSALAGSIARYAGSVPVLSKAQPRGVRIMEASTVYDPTPTGPLRNSQMMHRDPHALPLVYVIVALRDVTPQSGPFEWVGIEASDRVGSEIDEGARRRPHYLPDEQVRPRFRDGEVHEFIVPKGTVLIIDSSRCFHCGSRNPVNPRYHLQLAYVPACRTDFTAPLLPQATYPIRETDSRFRRMLLDREYLQ